LKRNTAKVSSGHKVLSAKDEECEIESFRYPFCACEPESHHSYPVCDKDDVNSDNTVLSGMTLVPFNQDLNRLMLVAKNGRAASYEVTWGGESKTFSAAQLAQGINLAAEFPANPFNAAFAKVDAAVAAKQAYETKEIKDYFRQTDNRSSMEAVTAQTDKVVEKTEAEREVLAKAVVDAFVPVTHVIRIVAK
jgi:hypothetical protein